VIRTREVVAEPPDYLLAMDFHDGQSLLQVLRRLGRPAVPIDEHIWILTKVLSGLGTHTSSKTWTAVRSASCIAT